MGSTDPDPDPMGLDVGAGWTAAALWPLLWVSPFTGLWIWSLILTLALPTLAGPVRLAAWFTAGLTVLAVVLAGPSGISARRYAVLGVALALDLTLSGPLTIQAVDAVWRHLSEATHG
jgi:hypothetical protein